MRNDDLYRLGIKGPGTKSDNWRHRLDYHVEAIVDLIHDENFFNLLDHCEQAFVVLDEAELSGMTHINTIDNLRSWINGVCDFFKLNAMQDDMPYAFQIVKQFLLATRPKRRPNDDEFVSPGSVPDRSRRRDP